MDAGAGGLVVPKAIAWPVFVSVVLAALLPPVSSVGPETRAGDSYDELVLSGPASDWLAFAYTNKARSFLWQSTNLNPMSEFAGFNAQKFRVVDGWEVWDGTSRLMPPAETYRFTPHAFLRSARGLSEEVSVPEGLDGFHLEYAATQPVSLLRFALFLEPEYDDAWTFADNVLVLRTNNAGRGPVAYVAVTSDRPAAYEGNRGLVQQRYPFDEYRVGNSTWVLRYEWRAGTLNLGALAAGERARVAVAVAASESAAIDLARQIFAEKDVWLAAKEARLRALVNAAGLLSDDASLRKAYNFALTGMDNLKVNETFGPSIWAGLPWFNNGWGRDTFISLRGAMRADGDFELAKGIARSFAAFQRDSDGRVPNLIPASGSPPYNSADATWWMILAIDELVQMTGDSAFAEEMFPVVAKAIDRGWATYGDPADGLMRADGKETWMDTSADPRVGKPIEVQALWMRALRTGTKLAGLVGNASAAAAWTDLLSRAEASFAQTFWNPERAYLYDYVDAAGTPIPRIRPNAFLAYDAYPRALSTDQVRAIAGTALRRGLVASFGVRSVEPGDPLYRGNDTSTWDSPAYHNGDIWHWLAGPASVVLAEARQYDVIDSLVQSLAADILTRNNLGTLPEILDGDDGEPKGTWTQAWSVAEFLRAVHQVLLGVRFRVEDDRLLVVPAPIPGTRSLSLPVVARGQRLIVNYATSPDGQRLAIAGLPPETIVELRIPPHARGFLATVREDGSTRTEEGAPDDAAFVTHLQFTQEGSVEVAYRGPSITILAPSGGERFTAGDRVRIAWQPDATLAGDIVTLEFSEDAATAEWTPITTVSGDSEINWTVPDAETTHARVRVVLRTAYGQEAIAESGDFAIARPASAWPLYAAAGITVVLASFGLLLWRRRRTR